MAAPEQPQHLESSALGTKEYWDDLYTIEIQNHSENPEDLGAIWFSDSGAEEKILQHLEDLELGDDGGQHEEATTLARTDVRILDLGTGNGHLLFALRDEGWCAQMVGVDYSTQSVELARRIQSERAKETEADEDDQGRRPEVTFERFDLLEDAPGSWFGDGFHIVLDKGTFDAISLNDVADAEGRKGFEKYGERVERLVRPGGYFLITSCNWTEEELRKWFESPMLEYHDRVRYSSFTFGGVKGQTVSSVCFRRRR